MASFIIGLLVAFAICLAYFAWDRRRGRYGRMRELRSGAPAEF